MISTVSAEDINSTNEIIDSNQDYSIDMSENNPDEEVLNSNSQDIYGSNDCSNEAYMNSSSSGEGVFVNPDFDNGLEGWDTVGTVSIYENGHNGSCVAIGDADDRAYLTQNVNWSSIEKIGFWYKVVGESSFFIYAGDTCLLNDYVDEDVDWTYVEYDASSFEGLNDFKVRVDFTEGSFYIDSITCTLKSTIPSNRINTMVSIVSSEFGVVVISLTEKDNSTKVVPGVEVSYVVGDGNSVSNVTDSEGKIIIPNLTGEVTIKASFAGNANYSASNATSSFNFTQSSETNTTGNITNETSSGNTTSGNNTNATGGNTTGGNNTIVTTTVGTKLIASNVNMVYNGGKSLVVTLKDENGNVLAGQTISIKLNGNTYTRTTNSKGQASLALSLVPKTYTATINFAGKDKYTKSFTTAKIVVTKATPKLTAAKKTFKVKTKTKKYTVTLKTNKGKVMKNTKVTLKVKGKTYTAKTNSKGKATFKITKLTKKGTYKAVVKYSGNKYYKALSKTVKIVVKK